MEQERFTSNKILVEEGSNSYFQAIFDNAGIGIVILDLNRSILRYNKAFQNLLNYSNYELQDISIKDITHPEDSNKDEELFNNIVNGTLSEYTCEKRYLLKDKSVIHVRVTYSSTSFDPNLEHKRILAIVEDISKEKIFEKKFEQEQNLLALLLEHIPDSIYFKDLGSRFIKVSDALARKHGRKADELIGKTDFDLFGLYHASEAFKDEQEIINTGKPIIAKEEKEDHRDGRTTWSSTTKMPLLDRNNSIIGTFGISRDITLRKKSDEVKEALFQISQAVFTTYDMSALFKKIHEMISTLMPAKNIVIALYNEKRDHLQFPYFVDQYDTPLKERKIKKGIAEYILSQDSAVLLYEDDFKKLIEEKIIEKKETTPLICLGVPLKFDNLLIGTLIMKDYENFNAYKVDEQQIITFVAEQIAQVIQRKRITDEITRYSNELSQLNATKDKFFSIIAHDLRNPFITILGFSDLLMTDYHELNDEERLYYIQEMKKSSEISHNLLQNLLQWSRSQTGKIDFHPQELDLTNLIRNNIELMGLTADRKSIKIINDVNKYYRVNADEDMVNTVLRNLLSNALKFTQKNGQVNINCEQQDGFVCVAVSDNGVGMSEEVSRNLFRIDISHSSMGTENEAGTGLGLILCKEFIEKNGGNIIVQSEPNKGSTFSFTLPLYKKN